MWQAGPPRGWPTPPQLMSPSLLFEIEACPRRWALRRADYSHIGLSDGYPMPLQTPALEGSVVHAALQTIIASLRKSGCDSLSDPNAITVLRGLGGFSSILSASMEDVVRNLADNPRVAPNLGEIRRRLESRLPSLRERLQKQVSQFPLRRGSGHVSRGVASEVDSGKVGRRRLGSGCYSEVELRALELGWVGIADVITLVDGKCEIRDFKTGEPSRDHVTQMRIYALLWARDPELNPDALPADRLVISYDRNEVLVEPATAGELDEFETEIKHRTGAARKALQSCPPEARPNANNCRFCPVRHLCEEYWPWLGRTKMEPVSPQNFFADLQISLGDQRSESCWEGSIEVSGRPHTEGPVLLRATQTPFAFTTGQRLRLLNASVTLRIMDSAESKSVGPAVTIVSTSEVFELPPSAESTAVAHG